MRLVQFDTNNYRRTTDTTWFFDIVPSKHYSMSDVKMLLNSVGLDHSVVRTCISGLIHDEQNYRQRLDYVKGNYAALKFNLDQINWKIYLKTTKNLNSTYENLT